MVQIFQLDTELLHLVLVLLCMLKENITLQIKDIGASELDQIPQQWMSKGLINIKEKEQLNLIYPLWLDLFIILEKQQNITFQVDMGMLLPKEPELINRNLLTNSSLRSQSNQNLLNV